MLIFSHENPMIVANIRNILDSARIEVVIKNEFAGGAVGELSAFDAWPEIWLVNERDQSQAEALINESQRQSQSPDWFCRYCKEPNDASFEICWNCSREE